MAFRYRLATIFQVTLRTPEGRVLLSFIQLRIQRTTIIGRGSYMTTFRTATGRHVYYCFWLQQIHRGRVVAV